MLINPIQVEEVVQHVATEDMLIQQELLVPHVKQEIIVLME